MLLAERMCPAHGTPIECLYRNCRFSAVKYLNPCGGKVARDVSSSGYVTHQKQYLRYMLC
jgi:hypothetical protein